MMGTMGLGIVPLHIGKQNDIQKLNHVQNHKGIQEVLSCLPPHFSMGIEKETCNGLEESVSSLFELEHRLHQQRCPKRI